MNRYRNFDLVNNESAFYLKQRRARGKKNIQQIRLRPFGAIDEDTRARIIERKDTWKVGSKLYKLATRYYGDQDLWWVIGYYNNKPIDTEWEVGDEILIPTPVSVILEALDV